ncbi:MAG: hypothetical protein ACI4QT_03775 [Kiritimatiellia bacterium]
MLSKTIEIVNSTSGISSDRPIPCAVIALRLSAKDGWRAATGPGGPAANKCHCARRAS